MKLSSVNLIISKIVGWYLTMPEVFCNLYVELWNATLKDSELFVSLKSKMIDSKQMGRIISRLVVGLLKMLDWTVRAVTWVTGLLFDEGGQLPEIKSDLLLLSATNIAKKIKAREVKCVDVMEAYINRIKDVEPLLNCVVEDRFEEAMKEAQILDELVVAGKPEDFEDMPLFGVPLTVKETIAVEGMSNNAARSRVHNNTAERDAEIIKGLREVGAIPIVVSNTPELCLYVETNNSRHGRTNNPYDIRRTCGGSSGGEVSLIGAGASVIGVGSDIAGSLRITAFFCGVFSHKPTPGYVSNDGHIPTSTDPLWDYYFTLGPITRYAEDLPLMLKSMVSEESKLATLKLEEPVDVSNLKIYYMYGEGPQSILQQKPGVECIKAFDLAVEALRNKCGCNVQQINIPLLTDTVLLNSQILFMNGIENVFQTEDDKPDEWGFKQILTVLFKKLTFQHTASISCVMYGPLKYLINLTPNNVQNSVQKKTTNIKNALVDLLKDDAVLLYPTFSQEAPLHNRMCSKLLDISYLSIFNILGLPVTQCPITLTKEGIPVGLQIAAAPNQDRLSLAVARALEKELGGWKPPSAKPQD